MSPTQFKSATVSIAGTLCDRRRVVRAMRHVEIADPNNPSRRLRGTYAIGALAGVHSSTVSRRLSAGGVLDSDPVGRAIECALLAHLPSTSGGDLARVYGAQPSAQVAQVAQPAVAPIAAAPIATASAPSAPAVQPVAAPTAQPSPGAAALLLRVRKPLLDARKAIQDGTLDSVCGIRKAALVARILGVLDAQGWAPNDALSAAYYTAVVAKEPADLRLHVVEPFVTEFGFEPKPPQSAALVRDPSDPSRWLHPCVPLLAALLRAGVHVWLYGEAGVGKSRAARDAARLVGRAAVTFACHKHTHTDDALGGKELRNGATVDRLGPWCVAMQAGAVLILEEPSKAHPGVLAAAHAMLEERELAVPSMLDASGAPLVVRAAPGFACVAADNAEAGRDPGRYVAVQQMDPAFLDRFAMLEVGPLPDAAELAIMQAAFAAGVQGGAA